MRAFWTGLLLLAACGRTTFDGGDNGRTVDVDKGERFTITLPASSDALAPRHRFSRPQPGVSGRAVRFRERRSEAPPPGADGARGRDYFDFEAVARGQATITFVRVFNQDLPPARGPIPAIPRREQDYTLTVRVK